MANLTNYINQFSVYEQDNGQMCMVLSNNKNNINAKSFLCAKIVSEDEDDVLYHVNYDSLICGTIVPHKILLECTVPVNTSRLKKYLYTVPANVKEKVKRGLAELIFGEAVYTLSEARSAIAVEDIRLKVEFEQQMKMSQEPVIEMPVLVPESSGYYKNAVIDTESVSNKDSEFDPYNTIEDIESSDEIITAPSIENDIEKMQEYMGKTESKKEKEIASVTMTEKACCVVVAKKRGRKKSETLEQVAEQPIEEEFSVAPEPIESVSSGRGRRKYKDIYSDGNYLSFLEDYKNHTKEEMSLLYGVDVSKLGNVCYRCKQVAKRNGEEELVESLGYTYKTYDKKGE